MIKLQIIGMIACLLEVTVFITWAINAGFDRYFLKVFWKVLEIVIVTSISICAFVVFIVMAVQPTAIINLFNIN